MTRDHTHTRTITRRGLWPEEEGGVLAEGVEDGQLRTISQGRATGRCSLLRDTRS